MLFLINVRLGSGIYGVQQVNALVLDIFFEPYSRHLYPMSAVDAMMGIQIYVVSITLKSCEVSLRQWMDQLSRINQIFVVPVTGPTGFPARFPRRHGINTDTIPGMGPATQILSALSRYCGDMQHSGSS